MNFEFIPGLKSPVGFGLCLGLCCSVPFYCSTIFIDSIWWGVVKKSVIDLLAQQHRQDRMNLFWFLEYEPD